MIEDKDSFPSITTVLSKTKDLTHIHKWRARVGEKEATRITTAATTRGTKMHDLCEKFLKNEHFELGYSQGELLFRTIHPYLMRFDNIRALETPLFSRMMKVAGTVDCIAEVDGELSIVDFKTSTKEKKEEWIEDYQIQAAFYARAFFEMSGELPKQTKILIALEDGGVQEFTYAGKAFVDHLRKLELRVKQYYDSLT